MYVYRLYIVFSPCNEVCNTESMSFQLHVPSKLTQKFMNLNDLDIFSSSFSFVHCFYLVLKSVNLDYLLRNLE